MTAFTLNLFRKNFMQSRFFIRKHFYKKMSFKNP